MRKKNYPQSSKWHAIADYQGVKSVAFTGSQSQAEAAASKLVHRGYGAYLMPAPADAPGGWKKHWEKEAKNPARLGSANPEMTTSELRHVLMTDRSLDLTMVKRALGALSGRWGDHNHPISEWVRAASGVIKPEVIEFVETVSRRENPARLGSGERENANPEMKSIRTEDYEIVARKRAKLADGLIGWTGVRRAAYATDRTVVGFRNDWAPVPNAYLVGQAGSSQERAYAQVISSGEIRASSEASDPEYENPARLGSGEREENPQIKSIYSEDYEIVSRQKAKLADGRMGWTGIRRAAYATDHTVIGFQSDWILVPNAYLVGQAGSSQERAYAKVISSGEIRESSEAYKGNPARLGSGSRFAALESKLAARGDITDPAALAAAIGRRKYGAKGMAKMAAEGKKRASGNPAGPDVMEFATYEMAERYQNRLTNEGVSTVLYKKGNRFIVQSRSQPPARTIAAEMKRRARERNPEDAARELSERFHGLPSDTMTIVETPIHVHEHKTALGDLTEMKLVTLNNAARDMTVKFKGDLPILASNEQPEHGTQLFIDGGDQELDLEAMGFDGEEWHKENMALGVLYEITYDTRKAMDGGQIVSYFHGLGEEDLKKSRSKPKLGVQPTLVYHPPMRAGGQDFPARLEIVGGRYNLLEAERGIIN